MPSPSPAPRRRASAVAPRNLSASNRGDLFGPTAGLHARSSSSSATRSPPRENDEHKENSTENRSDRGIQGRSAQNSRGTSKKPWVTHFSKSAGALTPTKRVLVERNSSCSPVREESAIRAYGEGFCDQTVGTTPPGPYRELEEAPATPGRVKGVAELSKRIQQFLEEREVVLGIKTGSSQEVASSYASITQETGQPIVSSPYNPYKSPFFERPKFLRLNGSASTMDECEVVSASKAVVDTVVERTTEELPLFEGDQALATPLQHIQFSINLSPVSTEDEDTAHEEKTREQFDKAAVELPSGDALQMEIQPIMESNQDYLSEACGRLSQDFIIPCVAESASKLFDSVPAQLPPRSLPQGGGKEMEIPGLVDEDGLMEALSQSHPEGTARQSQASGIEPPERKEDSAGSADNKPEPGGMTSQSNARDTKTPEIKEDEEAGHPGVIERQQQSASNLVVKDENTVAGCNMSMKYLGPDQMEDVEEEVCWWKGAGRAIFYGTLLAAFVVSVLISSAGPGLLPPSLINNPVHLLWHSSKYHQQSMLFVSRMEGLWSTENIYTPADIQVAVGRGVELFHIVSRLSTQARYKMKVFAQLTTSVLDDWWKVLLLHVSRGNHPSLGRDDGQHGRQFEWMQDYDFGEEWLEEIPSPEYTDWELLYEYDLGAANQFVLGSIPESLKIDLRRNFSHLSDNPEVKDLLEDLMKLKGGNTDEDRLEVLQYFWEYTRFSARAHEALVTCQVGPMGLENLSHQESSLGLPEMDFSSEQQLNGVPESYIPAAYGLHSYTSIKDSLDFPGLGSLEEQSIDELDSDSPLVEDLPAGAGFSEDQSIDELNSDIPVMEEQQDTHGKYSKLEEPFVAGETDALDLPGVENSEELDSNIPQMEELHESSTQCSKPNEETQPSVAPELSDVVLEMADWTPPKLYESSSKLPSYIPMVNENAVAGKNENEQQSGVADMTNTEIQSVSNFTLDIAQLATLATFLVVSIFILARAGRFSSAAKLTPSPATSVQFLRKSDQPQERLDGERQQDTQPSTFTQEDKHQITMIEELNEKFSSVLQSPEPEWLPLRSPQATRDEDLMRSPVPTSITSPYGSFTTYKLMSKEGEAGIETKLTPVRRSSRIRNHMSMSPKTNAVKRIAISPP